MRKSKRTLGQKVAFVADGNVAIHVTDLEKSGEFLQRCFGVQTLEENQ